MRKGSSRGRIALMGRNTILGLTSILILLLAIACSSAGRESNEKTTAEPVARRAKPRPPRPAKVGPPRRARTKLPRQTGRAVR